MYDMNHEYNMSHPSSLPSRCLVCNSMAKGGCIKKGRSCIEEPFYMISMYEINHKYNVSHLSSLPGHCSVCISKAKGGCIKKDVSSNEAPFYMISMYDMNHEYNMSGLSLTIQCVMVKPRAVVLRKVGSCVEASFKEYC